MDYINILYTQLSKDYNCSIEEVYSSNNIFTIRKKLDGRRVYSNDNTFLKICSVHGKLIFSCEDEIFLDWLKDTYSNTNADWFANYPNLRLLDSKLLKFGHQIEDLHHFYLPRGLSEDIMPVWDLKWYNQEEILQFKGDNRFKYALGFWKTAPDIIAVASIKDNEILGLAGASADSSTMWQIGIDVTPQGKHLGMGTYLVSILKNEILNKGILPFYGTGEFHMLSQKVAIQSGFIPTWAELYTSKF